MSDTKRLVHELHEDDLVALAQGADRDEIAKKISIAAQFIFDIGIKHGHDKITAMLVYYTYKHHKGFGSKVQPKSQFLKDFNRYFQPNRDKDGIYYLLDSNTFDLSEETYWAMRAEWRRKKVQQK